MNGRIVLGILLVLVVLAGLVGVGAYAYNVGVAQGMLATDKAAPAPGGVPYAYWGMPFAFHRVGFGFGFLNCLIPLFFFLLFFGLLRAFIWRGRWGHLRHMHGEHGAPHMPPMFEEWHRKLHETPTPPAPK